VRLGINLSVRSLVQPTLIDAIERQILSGACAPEDLVFEITETAAVGNIQHARAFAERLARLGCGLALDDFGAGFGSFYYLKHLPFDHLKIDGEFVRALADNPIDKLVIEAVVRIAQGLGKRTIAEFVEDERTLDLLRASGVDYAQGFGLGRPAPALEVLGLVEGPSDPVTLARV
jgi:EAL domain-containing protein (putative c-di-GMP-specific phosphodiesterase class I)